MAHYEGETLKERIERGPLKLDDAIDIATQVGQGANQHSRNPFRPPRNTMGLRRPHGDPVADLHPRLWWPPPRVPAGQKGHESKICGRSQSSRSVP